MVNGEYRNGGINSLSSDEDTNLAVSCSILQKQNVVPANQKDSIIKRCPIELLIITTEHVTLQCWNKR